MPHARVTVPLLLLAFAACRAHDAKWSYTPEARRERAPVVDATLLVTTFADERPRQTENLGYLYYAPLMPFGYQEFARPETERFHVASLRWHFEPTKDLARAIGDEIDAARVFRSARPASAAIAADYVMTGTLRATHCSTKLFSYGLSVYGALTWFAGLPAFHVGSELELDLVLTRLGGGPPLWRHTLRADDGHLAWLYAPGTDFLFPRMLKAAMPDLLTSLECALRQQGVGGAGSSTAPFALANAAARSRSWNE